MQHVSRGPATGPCTVCGKEQSQPCSRCRVDYYCGKAHQAQDWPRHKKGCGVFEVRSDLLLGRHLVATRDIPQGTVIMREMPLVAYPEQTDPPGFRPVCVGCCRVLPQVGERGFRAYYCERCGLPMCDEECCDRPDHRPECAILEKAKGKLMKDVAAMVDLVNWHSLAALRVWLKSKEQPRLLELTSKLPPEEDVVAAGAAVSRDNFLMMAYSSFRRTLLSVVDRVRRLGLQEVPPDAELRRAMATVLINGSIPLATGYLADAFAPGGLFAGLSLLEHSCVPNTRVWPCLAPRSDLRKLPDLIRQQYVLVASRDIKKGEHLSVLYGRLVMGPPASLYERRIVHSRYCFLCRCPLCVDPTQRGLNLEAWYCQVCKGEGRQQLVVLEKDGQDWRCTGCRRSGGVLRLGVRWEVCGALCPDSKQRPDARSGFLKTLELENRCLALVARGAEISMRAWEQLLDEALWPRGPLHATHHTVLAIKRGMVRQDPPDPTKATEANLRKCIRLRQVCRELEAACNMACPGNLNFIRGVQSIHLNLVYAEFKLIMYGMYKHGWKWPDHKEETQVLKEEALPLNAIMARFSITPHDKSATEELDKQLDLITSCPQLH